MTADDQQSTREALLSAGKTLILSKGYTATSIDQICAEVGITKGAFYYFFKNKESFAEELLAYNWSPIEAMQQQLHQDDTDPLHLLHQHIDFMIAFLPGDGRLMGIMMTELGESRPHIAKKVRGYFQAWTTYLEEIVGAAQTRYAPDADFDPAHVMQFIIMTIEGAPVVSRQLGDEAVTHARQHLSHYLSILFGQ